MSGARLLIDADACPVVEIALRAARARGVEVLLVCDDAHEMRREGARTVTVARGADSADLRLVKDVYKRQPIAPRFPAWDFVGAYQK